MVDDVFSEDPRTALIALRRLTDDELPWIEQRVVARARAEGWNWATIGRLLQRSRASVRQRFAGARLILRPEQKTFTTDHERSVRRALSDIEHRHRFEQDDDPVAW